MTFEELEEVANRTKLQGGSSLYLRFPVPKSKPRYGYEIHPRIKTIFGVCTVVNLTRDGGYIVNVPLEKVFKALKIWRMNQPTIYSCTKSIP